MTFHQSASLALSRIVHTVKVLSLNTDAGMSTMSKCSALLFPRRRLSPQLGGSNKDDTVGAGGVVTQYHRIEVWAIAAFLNWAAPP